MICQVNDSFVNGTNDGEAYPKRWIAVFVQVNREKKIATQLMKAGYETYVPTQQEIHQWSDRKKIVDRIVIPMIVFVRATVIEEKWLRELSYIFKLLALPGTYEDKRGYATPIPDHQIEGLRFLLENADSKVTFVTNLKADCYIRVVSGPLKGVEGVVSDFDERNTNVGVMVDGLGYAKVQIRRDFLEIINF